MGALKPILFPADATTFTSNGLGSLDPTRCVVTEARNGEYELECELTVDSAHYSDIANNMILAVVPGDGGSVHGQAERQAFRIYEITQPLNGIVTLSARHISYDLSYNTVMPFTASNITTAFSGILSHAVETCPFTFNTDKTTAASFKVTTPQTIRAILGGQQGSILDVYGGEYQWNNYVINLWNHRGTDTNVTLRYGKNLTDINQEQNLENVITGIVPYWANEDTVVTLPEKSVDSTYASSYPFKRTVPVDFSSSWEEAPTEAQLRARAQTYITANNIGVPKVSIKVSFVALWQTEEYKDIAPLERVHLCDTVGVVFEKYGINTRAEVIRTEWDCLAERYLSIELGEARSSMSSTIVQMNAEQTQAVKDTRSQLQIAIDTATAAINGAEGGYLVIEADEDGHPYRMLIMNAPTTASATIVWQYNQNGWGVSTNGIAGPYTLAATLDATYGAILNASFIRTGEMVADRIKGGIFESIDNDHKFYINMTTGLADISGATLRNADIEGVAGVDINLGANGLAFYRKSDDAVIGGISATPGSGVNRSLTILADKTLEAGGNDIEMSAIDQIKLDGAEIRSTSSGNIFATADYAVFVSADQAVDILTDKVWLNGCDIKPTDETQGEDTTLTIATGDGYTVTMKFVSGILVESSVT